MTPEQMAERIRARGAVAVAHEVSALFPAALADGLDYTRWSLAQRGGMVLFWLAAADPPPPSPLRAERDALLAKERDLLARSYHDADVRRERDAARARINVLDGLIREEERGRPRPAAPAAGILCVNAPEARRAEFARYLPDPAGPDAYPVTLLMAEEAFARAPF